MTHELKSYQNELRETDQVVEGLKNAADDAGQVLATLQQIGSFAEKANRTGRRESSMQRTAESEVETAVVRATRSVSQLVGALQALHRCRERESEAILDEMRGLQREMTGRPRRARSR